MGIRTLSYLGLSLSIFAAASPAGYHNSHHGSSNETSDDGGLTVATTSGILHGFINSTAPSVRQFRGIPFAQPPLGNLRWKAPIALTNTSHQHLSAAEYGPNPLQYFDPTATVWTVDTPEYDVEPITSEDCLTLSVTAPLGWKDEDGLLPVIIWMYGGGLLTGGQNTKYFEPSPWVERSQSHIVVVINYRVGIWGFPGAEGLDTQNLGLLDQRFAVEWVRDNIAAFGGDSSRMALWGQSAGGASVDWYNYAWYSDPIVSTLILDSGTAILPGKSVAYSNFTYVAEGVGCGGLNATEEVECMRGVNATLIQDYIGDKASVNSNQENPLTFYAWPDNKTYFSNYTDRAVQGLLADIPAIIGNAVDEGNALIPFSFNGSGLDTALSTTLTMSGFVCPATETVRLRSNLGLKSYRYVYSGNFTNESPRPWEGAYHCTELALLFGTYAQYHLEEPRSPTELMHETSAALQDAYLAFVSGGSEGIEGTGWLPYTVGGETARNFGEDIPMQDFSLAHLETICDGASYAP